MTLRSYDKVFLRGISLEDTAFESRELLSEAAAGPIAAVGGLLYPFCYIPLILWWARTPSLRLHPSGKWVAVALFALPALDALLLLSRSQMLVAMSMLYFSCACVLYQGRPLHRRLIKPLLAGFLALVIISVLAFSSRLRQMDVDIVFSILSSAYGFVLTPNQYVLAALTSGNDLLGGVVGVVIPLMQYYLHGLFEFGLLWERPDTQVFTFGTQHFAPYVKALNIFGLLEFPDYGTDHLYYRSGVFTSFFGPLWIDFGWWGIPVMLAFGVACKLCAKRARAGTLAMVPLHSYLCVVVFFMPVVNLVVSAQGMYILNAFLLLWLLAPRHVPHSRLVTA